MPLAPEYCSVGDEQKIVSLESELLHERVALTRHQPRIQTTAPDCSGLTEAFVDNAISKLTIFGKRMSGNVHQSYVTFGNKPRSYICQEVPDVTIDQPTRIVSALVSFATADTAE